MGYPNSYHGNSSNRYKGKDYYYSNTSKYHSSNYNSNKSPRRDYKKSYQKYNPDNEGVRNLSHCDIPSPVKKKDEHSEPKEPILSGFNLMGSFPRQQGPYQHIFQNQQNINISIISPKPLNLDSSQCDKRVMSSTLNSTTILSAPSINKRRFSSSSSGEHPISKDRDKRDTKLRNSYKDNEETTFTSPQKQYRSTIPRPPPKVPLTPFDKKEIHKPENPFNDNTVLPMLDYTSLNSQGSIYTACNDMRLEYMDTNATSIGNKGGNAAGEIGSALKEKEEITTLEPNFLLSKIPNKSLVSNFVDISQLTDLKYESVPKSETNTKSFLIYDEKYENAVEKFTQSNAAQKAKLKSEIFSIMQGIDHCEHDIRKIKYKIYQNEWKFQKLNVKANALDMSLNEAMKQD